MLLVLTRDRITLATFLWHSAPSLPDLSTTHPKYIGYETCSNHVQSRKISHTDPSSPPNTITLLLTPLTFRTLLLHTSAQHSITTFSSFSDSKPDHQHTKRPAIPMLSPSLKISPSFFPPHFHFFYYPSMYALKSYRDVTHLCLTSLSILKLSLWPPLSLHNLNY